MLGRDKKTAATTGASSSQDYRNHTLIAPSATVRGDIEFSGGLHIQGTVEGNVSVGKDGGRLVIGESGVVKGEIQVAQVVINGRVEGDVHATENLELAEKASVEGNVYYRMIEMVMGARVNGKLVRLDDERRNLPAPDASKAAKSEPEGKAVAGKAAVDNS
ncbi:MAG: bactofilin family protein [Alcanivorax sp.]|uniref:bactofilin family protein n=1 Tax=Alcanivorax sp. TaxID=1872427 RepID=UPI003A8D2DE5